MKKYEEMLQKHHLRCYNMTNQIIKWDISMQMRCKCEGHLGHISHFTHVFCFVEASDSGAVGRAGRAKTFTFESGRM